HEEINQKIKNGDAVVLTAQEMISFVEENGTKKAVEEIDVVTTGTFGAMCSSGAFFNFGHSDPPIKMDKVLLNGVEAYHGGAAVDCYLGVTKMSEKKPFEYGGGHVIEDLLLGKAIELEAEANGTDCYPRTHIKTTITLDGLNQAILCNPRNAYQRYICATNSTNKTLYTYMGKLLPSFGNATFSGAGELSPLQNDPTFETIGIGTRIFLGGGVGYVVGEGTQHNPGNRFGTLFLKGDLKQMDARYLRGAIFSKYGTSMFVGLGVPIPILNERIAKNCAVKDEDIITDIVDYGIPRRDKPNLGKVSYKQLKSGTVSIKGKDVRVKPLSSFKVAKEIAVTLKSWIMKGKFFVSRPVELISTTTKFKPLKEGMGITFVRDIYKEATCCKMDDDLEKVARMIVKQNADHVIVVNDEMNLEGILTSFDITKAVAFNRKKIADIVTKKVVSVNCNETLYEVSRKFKRFNISAMPVIGKEDNVIGIISESMLIKNLVPKPNESFFKKLKKKD
ncbi:MAG: homocysteine biosynthesis protein, partial [Promethearchaeota archaeon]